MTSLKNDKYLKSKTWYHGSEEPLEGPLRSIYLTPTLSLAKIHGTVVTAFKIASGASIVDLEEIDLQGSMDSLGYTDFHKNFNADILWYKEDWLRHQQQIYVVNPKAVKVIQKDLQESPYRTQGSRYTSETVAQIRKSEYILIAHLKELFGTYVTRAWDEDYIRTGLFKDDFINNFSTYRIHMADLEDVDELENLFDAGILQLLIEEWVKKGIIAKVTPYIYKPEPNLWDLLGMDGIINKIEKEFEDRRQGRHDTSRNKLKGGKFLNTFKDMFKNESFYHGTTQDLKAGDEILPPSITANVSEKGRKKNLDKVFFTKDIGSAKIYAGRAKHSLGGSPVIYEIEPMGEIEWLNQKQGTSVGMSSKARILRRVTESKMKKINLQTLVEQCVREELTEQWGDAYGRTWADGSPRQRWKDDDDDEWTPARARANAEKTRVRKMRSEMNRLLNQAHRLANKDLDVLNANLPSQMKDSAPFATMNTLFQWLVEYEDFKAVEELINNVGGEG